MGSAKLDLPMLSANAPIKPTRRMNAPIIGRGLKVKVSYLPVRDLTSNLTLLQQSRKSVVALMAVVVPVP